MLSQDHFQILKSFYVHLRCENQIIVCLHFVYFICLFQNFAISDKEKVEHQRQSILKKLERISSLIQSYLALWALQTTC